MIARIFARLSRKQPPPVTDNRAEVDLFPLFVRRGQRLNNRSREAAARFERVHLILAEGRKNNHR